MSTTDQAREGQAQQSAARDVDRSALTTQRPRPSRLPRLRRCRCCLAPRLSTFKRHEYYVGAAAVQYTESMPLPEAKAALDRVLEYRPDAELIRVCVSSGGRQYEVIRGGRWVNEWQGFYGRHRYESKEWRRR